MIDSPSVTIIVTAYNRLEYIDQAIESALSQTYRDREIIVVDDGSIPPLEVALMGYKGKIDYVYQKNKGLAAARNTGIRHARGKYVSFLDDDDLYEQKKLEVQTAVLDNQQHVGFVYSDALEFYHERAEKLTLNLAVGRNYSQTSFARLFFLNPNVRIPTVLFRKDSIVAAGMFDETLPQHEDGDILLKIALTKESAFSDYPSAKIRNHPSSMSKDRLVMYQSIIQSWGKILACNPVFKSSLGKLADERLAALYCQLGEAFLARMRFRQAFESFRMGWMFSKRFVTAQNVIRAALRATLRDQRCI